VANIFRACRGSNNAEGGESLDNEKEKEMKINIESDEDVSASDIEGAIQDLDEEIAAGAQGKETGAEPDEDKYLELNDKYMRLYAEFENYRKRVAKEKEEIQKFGTESLLYDLLTVIDTLELALGHANDDDSSISLKQGIEMTLKEFNKVLGKAGLEQIDALGKRFDPVYHEAMSHVERDDVVEGTVIEEFRKGYTFHDKLLRPALVSVSKAIEVGKEDEGKDENGSEELKNNNNIKEAE
jgi:molecular chaperone GrpE